MMFNFLEDDKNLVILVIMIMMLSMIFAPSLTVEQADLLDKAMTGLFGVAVGRATK